MRQDFFNRSFNRSFSSSISDLSLHRSSFSDQAISPLESLVLECALEEARSRLADALEYEMNAVDYARLRQLPGNAYCADCGSQDTEWSSVTFGIFLCAQCSGLHRAMGTHISRVRSVKMDSWSPEHLLRMEYGGNDQCNAYLLANDNPREDKYTSQAAQDYKRLLDDRVSGKIINLPPLPTISTRPVRRTPARQKSSPAALLASTTATTATTAATATTIAASAPTIVYMGRTFTADSVQYPSTTTTTLNTPPLARASSQPPRDWRLLDPDMKPFLFCQQDILDITSDRNEFARLQKSIKSKGAITNELVKQRMHIFVLNRKKRLAVRQVSAQPPPQPPPQSPPSQGTSMTERPSPILRQAA